MNYVIQAINFIQVYETFHFGISHFGDIKFVDKLDFTFMEFQIDLNISVFQIIYIL